MDGVERTPLFFEFLQVFGCKRIGTQNDLTTVKNWGPGSETSRARTGEEEHDTRPPIRADAWGRWCDARDATVKSGKPAFILTYPAKACQHRLDALEQIT